MSSLTEIKKIPLVHYKGDFIKILHLDKPYGEFSDPLVKIELNHKNINETSFVEIPYENLEELIQALKKTKDFYSSYMHTGLQNELEANTGGGE